VLARGVHRLRVRKDELTMTSLWLRTPAPLCMAALLVAALLIIIGK
jgi:hypothetical protein